MAERFAPGDLILDMDALYQAMSGLPFREKPDVLYPYVREAYLAAITHLAYSVNPPRAWILAGLPAADERRAIRNILPGADLTVFAVPFEECMRRIASDPERDQKRPWANLVAKWWRFYQPIDGEKVIIWQEEGQNQQRYML